MRLFQSGLDIVRKSPGRHKIAIVQTTIIDGEARLIRLTMVLAHSSGKCVSSDWQVCPFAETASPHRMGAALSNARLLRFSRWFGIAGKDDLDAADLGAAPKPGVEQPPRSDHRSQSNGHVACSARESREALHAFGKTHPRARPIGNSSGTLHRATGCH
jgi:hypothetical protein